MLNNRPRNGPTGIDWRQAVLGRRHERKAVELKRGDAAGPCGYANCRQLRRVVHIRELNLATGGLGCALWDGGVVLARVLFDHPELLHGRSVLELGAGCGLAGIVAGWYADRVTVTDCSDSLVENMSYNIELNADNSGDTTSDDEAPRNLCSCPEKYAALANTVTAGYLDWDAVGKREADETNGHLTPCSRLKMKGAFHEQTWRHCVTCYPGQTSEGACSSCALTCHHGHELGFEEVSRFRCDCFERESDCVWRKTRTRNVDVEPVDVIIGAELTYCLLAVESLLRTLQHFLKEDGIFYEILSEDRDGVSEFVHRAGESGFEVDSCPVPEQYTGQYGTRKWTFQDTEKFRLFSFRRLGSSHPKASEVTRKS